jgi:hypothetical protein
MCFHGKLVILVHINALASVAPLVVKLQALPGYIRSGLVLMMPWRACPLF